MLSPFWAFHPRVGGERGYRATRIIAIAALVLINFTTVNVMMLNIPVTPPYNPAIIYSSATIIAIASFTVSNFTYVNVKTLNIYLTSVLVVSFLRSGNCSAGLNKRTTEGLLI